MILRHVAMGLREPEEVVGHHRSFTAEMVTPSNQLAIMAFLCSLLGWPDRALAQSSTTGSNVIGKALPAKLVRSIRPNGDDDVSYMSRTICKYMERSRRLQLNLQSV